MSGLQHAFDHHAFVFWVVTAIAVLLVALWTWRIQVRARRIDARLDDLFHGSSSDTVAAKLAEYFGTVRSTANAVARMKAEHDEIAAVVPHAIQHVGLVRFSPFHDTGGDQSFALALLDGRLDGVVVTALHSRSDSRLYAKPVQGGESSYALTPEERRAMDDALSQTPVSVR
jgi:hypothetical protein